MTGGTREDEEVPDGVVEGELFPDKEDDAEGVGEASCDEEPETAGGEGFVNGFNGDDDEPAHEDIKGGG